MANTNLTVVFGDSPPEDGSETYGNLSIDLDPVANDDTSFTVGDTAYLRVLSQGFTQSETYEMYHSGGSIERVRTGIPYQVEEDVTFALASEASLRYLPVGSVSIEWIGNVPTPGVVTVTENDRSYLRASEPIVAVARVRYETLGDRWALAFDQEGTVVVVARREGKTASATVNFGAIDPADEEVGPFSWWALVKNKASGEPEAGVTLAITGPVNVTVVTDGNGRAFLGLLPAGTYQSILTRDDPEIIPSGEDSIDNDQFTIPSTRPAEEEEVI